MARGLLLAAGGARGCAGRRPRPTRVGGADRGRGRGLCPREARGTATGRGEHKVVAPPAEESTRFWGRTASAFLERLVCRAASRWNHYTGRQEWTTVSPGPLLRIPL